MLFKCALTCGICILYVIYLTQMATCWSIYTLLVTCIAILIKRK